MEAKTNKITFKLDPINDQKYGTATKLEGKLEFMLKPEEFYFPESIRNVERLNKATNELVPILRDLWPDLLDEQVFTKIKDYAMASSLLNGLDLENPRMKILTIWCALGYSFDDLLDMLSVSGNESEQDNQPSGLFTYKSFTKLWLQIQEKQDFNHIWEILPSVHSAVETMKQVGIKCTELSRNHISNFDKKIAETGLSQETKNTFLAVLAMEEFKKKGEIYSITTAFELYRFIAAVRLALEFFAIIHEINISKEIRNDILFESAVNNYSDITMYYNCIFGLPRDVRLSQEDGPLMFLVAEKNYTLQQAFDEILNKLYGAYNDFKLNTSKLCTTYSDDENVMKFCKLMATAIDGTVYGYKVGKRYGVQDKICIPGY